MGSAGFIGFLSIDARSIPFYLLCEVISFVIAFLVTFLYGESHDQLVNPVTATVAESETKIGTATVAEPAQPSHNKAETVLSPVSGQAEDLSKINDDVFSQKMMGDGEAIVPADGTIYAPVDGEITVAYATKHAYGLTSANEAEILIHIGQIQLTWRENILKAS